MAKKRDTDKWNEQAATRQVVMEVRADQFVDNVAQNSEGISADLEKYTLDQTTTPKVLPANKRERSRQ